jgi:hypothetical protein
VNLRLLRSSTSILINGFRPYTHPNSKKQEAESEMALPFLRLVDGCLKRLNFTPLVRPFPEGMLSQPSPPVVENLSSFY